MKRVGIVNVGLGNVDSVARALEACGGEPVLCTEPAQLSAVQAIVLPGVGAFRDAMRRLVDSGLRAGLEQRVLEEGTPFLGVCLGMQLLASRGAEGGDGEGLGWIPGRVVRLEAELKTERIPHVGWNEVELTRESALFEGIPTGKDFYFCHSYHLSCDDAAQVVATTPYCGRVTSAVARGHIHGVQFHPEKSWPLGRQLLRNFLEFEA